MRRIALLAAALAAATALAMPSAGSAGLQGQLSTAQSREQALAARKGAEAATVSNYQARIDDLDRRVAAFQVSLDLEKTQLFELRDQLRTARAHLAVLGDRLSGGRKVLAAELRAQYVDPAPDIVSIVVNATSFADLLERADAVKRVQRRNVSTLKDVAATKREVTTQTRRLGRLERRQQQITAGVLIQRNEVAALEQSQLARQARARAARDRTGAALAAVRARRAAIEKQLQAQIAPAAAGGPGFSAHGGSYGFFQAPGTNYSVGDEPEIARRLDRLGKDLHLHLIGISGYRTPQHSVEVGGFPNDPHTKGQASDTPGVEGVPEATLNRYGLTRPFGGAAEADHIQLVGSI